MTARKPLYNIAHRGARSLAPENTMAAFRMAWQVGAHGIETDVSVTADGKLVLFHDATLLRTTNVLKVFPHLAANPVHTFSWKQLQQLDAGSWFIENDPFGSLADGTVPPQDAAAFAGIQIPLLEEALCFIRDKQMYINIEIKPHSLSQPSFTVLEDVLDLIRTTGLSIDSYSISSFYHPLLHRVKELQPQTEVNALIGEDENLEHDWGSYDFEIYNANVKLITPEQLENARRKGCRVNLYTVNNLEEMKYYLSLGAEKIITDFPQLLP